MLCSVSAASIPIAETAVLAQSRTIDVVAMPLADALNAIASQTGTRIAYDPDAVPGRTSSPVKGAANARDAVETALQGTGLQLTVEPDGHMTVANDIVVTAQRDEAETSFRVDGAQSSNRSGKTLKELPQGTQVVTSALIRQQQAITLNDALRNSAGVVNNLGNVQGTPSFTIRGSVAGALQNGVASNGSATAIDTIERIEILKGPAAILAGADNLGGVVNLVDKRPSADPILDVLLQYGTFEDRKIVVDASNALNDSKTLSARMIGVQAGSERSFGGYGGRREKVLAPSLRYKTGTADYVVGLNTASTVKPLENFRILNPQEPGQFLAATGRIGEGDQGFRNDVTRFYGSAEQKLASWLTLVARGSHTRDRLRARVIAPAGYADPDDGNALLAFNQSFDNRQQITSADGYARVEFTTGPLKHAVTAGYNYVKSSFASFNAPFTETSLLFIDVRDDNSGIALTRAPVERSFRSDSRQDGYYIQDFVDIGRLHLLAGVRRNKFTSSTIVYGFDEDLVSEPAMTKADTPNLGAVFDMTSNISVYANYSKGFSPTFGLTCDGEPIAVPDSQNLEGGVKADLFSRRLSFTASAYRLREGQTTVEDFACPLPDRVRSVGGIETKGIELDLNGQVTPGLAVSASYTFADYRFQETVSQFGTVPSARYRHKYSAYVTYDIRNGPLQGLGVAGGAFGNGRSFVDFNGQVALPAQVQFDGNLIYRAGSAVFNVGVKNLTNRRLSAVSSSPTYVAYLQPRTILATLTYRFFK